MNLKVERGPLNAIVWRVGAGMPDGGSGAQSRAVKKETCFTSRGIDLGRVLRRVADRENSHPAEMRRRPLDPSDFIPPGDPIGALESH